MILVGYDCSDRCRNKKTLLNHLARGYAYFYNLSQSALSFQKMHNKMYVK